MKKIFSILLVVMMLASMALPAFAIDAGETVYLDTRNMTVDIRRVELCTEPYDSFRMNETSVEGIYETVIPLGIDKMYFFVDHSGGGISAPVVDGRFQNIVVSDLQYNMFVIDAEDGGTGYWTDYTPPKEGSDQGVQLVYEVAPSFTVSIPETVTLGGTAVVEAEDVVVPKGKRVEVSLSDTENFTMTSAEGATITYSVIVDGNSVSEGETILAVDPTDGKTGETEIAFVATSDITYAGKYEGTAIFTVAVKDTPYFLFYFGELALKAEENMTWGDWVDSSYNDGNNAAGLILAVGEDNIVRDGTPRSTVWNEDGPWVKPDELIIPNGKYMFLS